MKVIIPGILVSGLFALLLYFAVPDRICHGSPDLQKEIYKTTDGMESSLEKDAGREKEDGMFEVSFCFDSLQPAPVTTRFSVRMKAYTVFITLLSPPPDHGFIA